MVHLIIVTALNIWTWHISIYCDNVGENIVNLTVTDASGNPDSLAAIVTVINDFEDTDNDDIPDNCDDEILPDFDGDGVEDSIDNCPETYNPDQSDIDNDGIECMWFSRD